MNKIILDKVKIIDLNIEEDTVCNIKNNQELEELNIYMKKGSSLTINEYIEVNKKNYNINIIHEDNTSFIYNHSFKTNELYNLNINIDLKGNKSKNIINIHGINDVGKSNIKIDGSIKKDTIDNELDEKIKILNINNGFSNIQPNMYVDTKNVIANHAASITNINEDYLFYLNSKGINSIGAKELIINGFLNNDAK